jgi:hypothetical protein
MPNPASESFLKAHRTAQALEGAARDFEGIGDETAGGKQQGSGEGGRDEL